ncbi:MAG TPA: hypothetical protein VL866_05755 [Pyrinomonadaceae bacterium]|nr:hypothetical protein [Pyrinomonadaceae bacterium]
MNSLYVLVSVVLCCYLGSASAFYIPRTNLTVQDYRIDIQINHDTKKDVITARLVRFRIAENVDHYHTLDLGAFYTYPRKTDQTAAAKVDLELYSVVKARQLNADLYVVFLIDGKEVHFGSNRSAIRSPVRGRPWIGERMVFSVPLEEFQKLASANELAIKMGGVRVDLNDEARTALRMFAEKITQTAIRASSSLQKTFPHPLSFAQARGGYPGKRSMSEFA